MTRTMVADQAPPTLMPRSINYNAPMSNLQNQPLDREKLAARVAQLTAAQPVTDLHTHCYAPAFGASPDASGLLLWGVDELVTYHYLIAEVFRVVPASVLPYEDFWAMPKAQQAEHIWKNLFIDRTPLSEACRGVITTLARLGLDPSERSLAGYRAWFAEQKPSDYIDRVMEIANVDRITMTNEVFSPGEHELWMSRDDLGSDSRFDAVLRIDKLLLDWPGAAGDLRSWGYDVADDLAGATLDQVKRFLTDWLDRMQAVYVATSLPPTFRYPDASDTVQGKLIEQALMPVLADRGLPWAMMIGSQRGVNPALRDAGDVGGKADVLSVANLAARFPGNKFMVTMLSRENQHELAVVARKFGNLLVFGCWWFLNNPLLIEEITRMRLELLGATFSPQHSDARILDQLIYKWDHSRRIIAKVLTDKYADLHEAGYPVTEEQITQDLALLLRDNYRSFVGL